MDTFTTAFRPSNLAEMRKTSTVHLAWLDTPFVVETQEGPLTISPETTDDWDDGYYIAYPSDGSKPYGISKSFVEANYEAV